MKVIAAIPARFASTRLPGKPLIPIQGKPLLQWVVEGVKASRLIDDVLVATDHPAIENLAKQLGVRVAMTESSLASGTDRIEQALRGIEADVVINVQGDEPLIEGRRVDQLIEVFLKDSELQMATMACPISRLELSSPHVVKVILDQNDFAIYFSRFAIPYTRQEPRTDDLVPLKHIGMYGYSRRFLEKFCQTPMAEIEKFESLEQLRALYLGARIKVIQVETANHGVDTEDDIKIVSQLLSQRG